jgi:hypothetical protein
MAQLKTEGLDGVVIITNSLDFFVGKEQRACMGFVTSSFSALNASLCVDMCRIPGSGCLLLLVQVITAWEFSAYISPCVVKMSLRQVTC